MSRIRTTEQAKRLRARAITSIEEKQGRLIDALIFLSNIGFSRKLLNRRMDRIEHMSRVLRFQKDKP
jgi:hypothetical protein